MSGIPIDASALSLRWYTLVIVASAILPDVNTVWSCPPEAESAVTVWVFDDANDSPVSGAVISIGTYNTLPAATLGRTNSAGRWQGVLRGTELELNQDGKDLGFVVVTHCMWVTGDGYVPKRVDLSLFRQDSTPGRPSSVVVRIVRAHPIRGRILQDSQKPVAKEPVLLVAIGDDYPVQFETATDGDGRFEWKGCPGGELYLALGIGGADSSPVFQRLGGSGNEIVVRVPAKWQGNAGENQRTLLYVEHANNDLVFPIAFAFSSACPILELSLSSSSEPLRHLILSVSEDWESIRYFSILGKNSNVRQTGELSPEPIPRSGDSGHCTRSGVTH